MKLSIIVPVYYNAENLIPLYDDIKKKVLEQIDYDYELIMVDDGSGDNSYEVMKQLRKSDKSIRIYRLSRNFGSHAAILCGLKMCEGDCAVVKAADLQEPSELIMDMVESWKSGNNVVLGTRNTREEGRQQVFFADMYYWLVRKTALSSMPEKGFDVYLIDRKVIDTIIRLDEPNSALTGQILWCGFRTSCVGYTRKAREIGKSRWTLKKKIRLVSDTLFGFSTLPIQIVNVIGSVSLIVALIWTIIIVLMKLSGQIDVSGWSVMFIFQLFSFGITMMTLGILGGYLWRTFDVSRRRPPFIIEDKCDTDEV